MTPARRGRGRGPVAIGIVRPAEGDTARRGGFVDLAALARELEAVRWSELQLASRGRRPVSPRLPHAILLHLAHDARAAQADPDAAAAHPAAAADPVRLGVLTATTGEVAQAVLDALVRAGLLLDDGESAGQGSPRVLRIAPRLLGPVPRAGTPDWERIAESTVGSPSAWVLAHHLAYLLHGDTWTPLSRRLLEEALGCGTSGVRAALDRLVAERVIERREQRGGVSAYRFAAHQLAAHRLAETTRDGAGGRAGDRTGDGAGERRPATGPERPTASPHATARAAAGDTGVSLQIGGVDLDVPPGMRVVVSVGPDGRPRVSIA